LNYTRSDRDSSAHAAWRPSRGPHGLPSTTAAAYLTSFLMAS